MDETDVLALEAAYDLERFLIEVLSGEGNQSFNTAASLADYVDYWRAQKDKNKKIPFHIMIPKT